MKRTLFLNLMKLLFICYFAFSSLSTKGVNLIVSGITSHTEANGTYLPFETLNGHDSWKHESKEYYIYYKPYNSIPYWNIDVDTDDADVLFYSEGNPPESSPTLVVSWTTLSGSGSPNVIEETLFPEISVSGNNTYITSGDISSGISDFTEFTYAEVTAGTSARTFTITNGGGADLLIGSITFTGANAADFSVTSFPLSTIAKTTSSDFIVTFNPSGEGIRTATISISNNDSDENPFTFGISGEGIIEEDLSVTGIVDPLTANGTYEFQGYLYGYPYWKNSAANYYLYNDVFQNQRYWNFDVNLSDDEGTESNLNDDNGLFYKLSTNGTPKGLSDWDSIKAPYTGDPIIVATIAAPEIDVTGNSKSIASGDVTPDFADYTHFGSLDISSGTRSRTYTIKNSGNATLTLSGATPYVSINGDAASDFTITSPPSNSIAPGSSTTFTVSFDASSDGDANANITISNNDSNESTYTFNIRGSGFTPENIELSGVTNPLSANGVYVHQGILFEFQYWKFVNGADTYYIYNDEYDGSRYWNIDRNTVDDDGVEGNISDDDFLFFTGNISVTPVGLTGWSRNNATGLETEGTPVFGTKEIFVEGNSEQIVDGDAAPSIFDHTDFGSVSATSGTIVRTFTIGNSGNLELSLIGVSPYVAISGDAASDFSVTSIPSSTISGGSSTTFQITFDPSASGIRTATLSIANDDNDENPFNFTIQGTGINTAPTASSFSTSSGPYTNNVYTFSTSDFGYSDGDSDPLDHVRVTTIPGSGTLYIDADNGDDYDSGEELANNDQVSKADLDAGNLQFYTTNSTSTSFVFDVNDGTDYSASTYTATLSVSDLTSTTYTGTGNWSETANWSPGIPGTSTEVTIAGNCTVEADYEVADMTISLGADVTISSGNTLTVSGTLTNNAGTSGLVLDADASGQGMLMNNSTGVEATVKQYLVKDQWHYVGSPVTYVPDLNAVYSGCYIAWNEEAEAYSGTSSGWYYLTAGDSLIAMGGYAVRYGWTDQGNVKENDLTTSFTGILNTGVIDTIFDSEFYGYNFVSNPYPVTIDWSGATNVSSLSDYSNPVNLYQTNNAIYLWHPELGSYGSYVGGNSTNGQTQYIAPTQGFFVQVTNVTSGLSFTDAAKISSEAPSFKSTIINPQIKLSVTADEKSDETVVCVNTNATLSFDGEYDAAKMVAGAAQSATPQLYSVSGDEIYSINSIPEITEETVIPLKVLVKTKGEQKLVLKELENYNYDYPIVLFDENRNKIAELEYEDYVFKGEEGEVKTFYLGFKSVLTTLTDIKSNTIKLISENRAVKIQDLAAGTNQVSVYTVSGMKIFSGLAGAGEFTVPLPRGGIYIVKVIPEMGDIFNGKVYIN